MTTGCREWVSPRKWRICRLLRVISWFRCGKLVRFVAADFNTGNDTVMARSKSSKRWLNEHFDDAYVRMAQQQSLRSRSAFKLIELHEKYDLIRPGMVVVDLGAAPGGWTWQLVNRGKHLRSLVGPGLGRQPDPFK